MLSTASGFTPGQAQRYRAMFHLLLVGVVIMTLGVGILCFGRMYTFDSSRYDLFTVFGVIIVAFAAVTITVPVFCQMRIYLEVQRASKGDALASGDYAPAYAPAYAPVSMATQQRAAPYGQMGTGTYQHQQHQQQQQMPFSSAAYMMGQQQRQQLQQPMIQQQSMMQQQQRMDAGARQKNASLSSEDTMRQQRLSPIWSSADKQQPF